MCMCRKKKKKRKKKQLGFHGIPAWLLGNSLNNKSQRSNMSAAMLTHYFDGKLLS